MTSGEDWPYCVVTEGTCLAYQMGQTMGASLLEELVSFVLNAQEGSRLILQKNRDGCTLQATGPVNRSVKQNLELSRLREFRQMLNAAPTTRPQLPIARSANHHVPSSGRN